MLFDKTPAYEKNPEFNQTMKDYVMLIVYDMQRVYQVLWGIFLICLGSAMLLTSNGTLRVCVFLGTFVVLFFFMSWTFIQLINPEYVDDALGYTLITISFLISCVCAWFMQRISYNYLSPFFAAIVFYWSVGYAVKLIDMDKTENRFLTEGMQLLAFVFGLYLGQRLTNQIRVFFMCAIGSYIITFGIYLLLNLLPLKEGLARLVTYWMVFVALTILTTIFMREEMTNIQTVFIFDPKKARREE